MGGFKDSIGNIIRFEELKDRSITTWPQVKEDEINDKSNSDAFTKIFVVGQTTWFVVQLIARIVQGLAITELEIMTLAYGFLCPLLYWLWWDKPYDVQTPIVVSALSLAQPDDPQMEPVNPVNTQNRQSDSSASAFPSFATLTSNIFEDSVYHVDRTTAITKDEDDGRKITQVVFIASATIFGCIHCIPWNFQFPTTFQRKMWIYSASIIAITPPISGCVVALKESAKSKQENTRQESTRQENTRQEDTPLTAILKIIHATINSVYFMARVILIAQAFVLLRDLSPSAAQPVTWSRLIPHV